MTYQKLPGKAVLCPFIFCFLDGDLIQLVPQNVCLGVHGMMCETAASSVMSEQWEIGGFLKGVHLSLSFGVRLSLGCS